MAGNSLFQVLIPAIGLVINSAVQILAVRFLKRLGVLKSIFAGFFCGFVFVLIMHGSIYAAIANILTYSAFGYCYFHFINLGETARRIRLLRELYEAKEGLTKDQILSRYNAKEIVKIRMARLLGNGQIIFSGDKYYAHSKVVLFISKIMLFMKWFILGKKANLKNRIE